MTEDAHHTLSESIFFHQLEAERLFSGAVFIDPDHARQTCGWLEPDLIADDKIREFWRGVKNGEGAGEAAIRLNAYFEIMQNVTRIASSLEAPYFASAIASDVYLRDSARLLGEMAAAIQERSLERLKTLSQSIADHSPASGDRLLDAADIGALFIGTLDDIGARIETTGLASLDFALGGYECQTLTIIAGRPGMGKTSLGLQGCTANATAGRKVLLFSLEMSGKSLWARLACGRARVSWRDIKARRATPDQVQLVKDSSSALMSELGDKLIIDDSGNLTNEDLWRKVSITKPDIVFLDHLALTNSLDRSGQNEVVRLGIISRRGKMMAKAFDIPVVYLAQLSRANEQRDNKRPQLSDIRGSGEIEQDADNVLFIHRPDYYEEVDNPNLKVVDAQIIAAKVRDGRSNICVYSKFNLEEQKFYPVRPKEQL